MILLFGSVILACIQLASSWSLMHKWRVGWAFSITANLVAIPYDLITRQYGFVVVILINLCIAARGWRTWKMRESTICPKHGIPTSGCGGFHEGYYKFDPENSWCYEDGCPAAVCAGPHWEVIVRSDMRAREVVLVVMRANQFKDHNLVHCPACDAEVPKAPAECGHPFHTIDPSHNYNSIVSREGDGADAGGTADPLVQEPTE